MTIKIKDGGTRGEGDAERRLYGDKTETRDR